jgi:ABC-type oligopeptide transport system substrate-binding subunit
MEMAQYFNLACRFEYKMALHIMTAGTGPEEWLTPYFGPLDESTFYKWSNPEIWDMVTKQSFILDEKKRIPYVKELQRKINDDASHIFLYTQDRFGARRPYVHFKPYMLDFQPIFAEFIWMEKH